MKPKFHRDQYEYIAQALSRIQNSKDKEQWLIWLSELFQYDNPSFNPKQFAKASKGVIE